MLIHLNFSICTAIPRTDKKLTVKSTKCFENFKLLCKFFGCWFERRTPRRESEVDAEKGKDRFQENFEKMWFTEVFAVPRSTFLEGIHDRLVGWARKLWQLVKQVNFWFQFYLTLSIYNKSSDPTTPFDDQVTKLAANLHSSWETFSIQVKFSFSEFFSTGLT